MNASDHTIRTDTDGLEAGQFELPVNGGTMQAYYAAPAGNKNVPVVLVVQEIFGLNEHTKDVCRRIAKLGYFAVGANLYQRQGAAETYTDIPKLIAEIVAKVPDEQVLSDLDSSVSWAAKQGANAQRVGITGFCWGGRLTWMYAAHNANVRAGVAWYGKLTQGHGPLIKRNAVDIVGELKGPVLGLYGGLDKSIPVADVEIMREKLKGGNEAAKASELVVYPESDHAFFADYRANYREADAKDGWRRLTDWFKQYL